MRGSRFARFVAVAVGSLVAVAISPISAAHAGSLPFAVDEDQVYAPVQVDGERFGDAVALEGDTMVVGVPMHAASGGVLEAGIVYIYERVSGAWLHQATLSPSVQAANDHFGASVAICGDHVVVGAPGYDVGDADSGAAFVFTRTGSAWSSAGLLPTGDAIGGDKVGQSVDIEYGTIVVGCPGAGAGRGEVRPLTWDGDSWAADPVLQDPDGVAGDRLGECVSLTGVTVLASATGDDVETLVDAGSIVSFVIGGSALSYEAKITAPAPVAGEGFGGEIDLQRAGNLAVVGSSSYDDGTAADVGRAYVYGRGPSGWERVATLENPETNLPEYNRFGSSVAYDGGDLIIVGAAGADGFDGNDGAAYYFQLRGSAWTFVQAVTPDVDPCCVAFGEAVALSAGTAAVGAPLASSWED